MNGFNLFVEKFVGRYLGLIGVRDFKLPHSPVSVSGLIAGLVILVLISSAVGSSKFERDRLKLGYSPTLAENFLLAAKSAAEENDYVLAEQLYEMGVNGVNINSIVLGVQSEAEETVFPEIALEKELVELDRLLAEQPTHRDFLTRKAIILYQLRLEESAWEILEQLKMIDPNNKSVKELEKLLLAEE